MRHFREIGEIDEFFKPRGLEMYVPRLSEIRRSAWTGLTAEMQTLLEVGDYIGLDRAISLKDSDLHELATVLPGPTWRRVLELKISGRDTLFSSTLEDVIAGIADALRGDEVKY